MPSARWHATGCGSFRLARPGVFEVRWRPGGRHGPQRKRLIPGTEHEIRAMLASGALTRARGRAGMPGLITWPDAIELYREHLTIRRNVTPEYLGQVLAILEEIQVMIHRPPGEVAPADLDRWLNGMAKALQAKGCPGWARTCNKKRMMAQGLFRFLRRKRLIESNPFEAVDTFVTREPVRRALRPEEYAAVWRACEPSLRDLLDFLLGTGCRFSEAARMTRADLAGGVWTIPRRKARDVLRLALPPAVQALVDRQPAGDPVWRRWVPRKPGTGPRHSFRQGTSINTAWLDAALRARCKAAGVPAFSAHALRHAAADWARAAGVPALWIRDTLGHSTVTTTERYAGQSAAKEVNAVLQAVWDTRSQALGVKCVSRVKRQSG